MALWAVFARLCKVREVIFIGLNSQLREFLQAQAFSPYYYRRYNPQLCVQPSSVCLLKSPVSLLIRDIVLAIAMPCWVAPALLLASLTSARNAREPAEVARPPHDYTCIRSHLHDGCKYMVRSDFSCELLKIKPKKAPTKCGDVLLKI
jgi:hypothetical protein